MVTIVDYGMGNLRSLKNAFEFLGEEVSVTSSSQKIAKAKKIVLPGVGNFGKAVENLNKQKITPVLKKSIQQGVAFLGICLGLQLLFEKSEESPGVKGLTIFQGKAVRFKGVKIPQIGWNQLEIQKRSAILKGIAKKGFVYFVHSFYVEVKDKKIIASMTHYGKDFCSAVESKNIFGLQFHPEKSGKIGLGILKNFIKL